MLLVQLDGALQRYVANDITVRQVLGKDARAGLHLLGNLVVVVALSSKVRAIVFRIARGTGDCDVVGAELCVVEEKRRLHGSLLFESDFCALRLALGGDFDIGDFAAVQMLAWSRSD